MIVSELIEFLKGLPQDAQIYTRVGRDNAWPSIVSAWEDKGTGQNVVYFDYQAGDHRNFPSERGSKHLATKL